MRYALINNSVVTNIIFLNPSNASEFPNVAPLDGLPVIIGDTYQDGKFYRDGVEVVIPPEPEIEEPDFNIEESYQDAVTALEILGYTEEESV